MCLCAGVVFIFIIVPSSASQIQIVCTRSFKWGFCQLVSVSPYHGIGPQHPTRSPLCDHDSFPKTKIFECVASVLVYRGVCIMCNVHAACMYTSSYGWDSATSSYDCNLLTKFICNSDPRFTKRISPRTLMFCVCMKPREVVSSSTNRFRVRSVARSPRARLDLDLCVCMWWCCMCVCVRDGRH